MNWPGTHVVQLGWPTTLAKDPAAHGVHKAALPVENCPIGHAVHVPAPSDENRPLGHAAHTVLLPELNWPAVQAARPSKQTPNQTHARTHAHEGEGGGAACPTRPCTTSDVPGRTSAGRLVGQQVVLTSGAPRAARKPAAVRIRSDGTDRAIRGRRQAVSTCSAIGGSTGTSRW